MQAILELRAHGTASVGMQRAARAVLWAAALLGAGAWCAAEPVSQHALLVGCTEYPNSQGAIKSLRGPANDVPMFAKLLHERFRFPRKQIVQLVGWPENERLRPTRANIAAGFERLIRDATSGSQVVILLSGHGAQTPALEADTEELDGLDEVFLPADAGLWSDEAGELLNSIRDNQIDRWLERLRAKGANVWILCDCCHSGTMTRGIGGDDLEQNRGLDCMELGIPATALANAAKRARANAAASDETTLGFLDSQAAADGAKTTGSLVAFFAAQAFEKAPELPCPSDAPRTPEHVYGLMSYVLTQTLQQCRGPLSYGDLGRRLISQYRAERGPRSPTPGFIGDLDREVLGARLWPSVSMRLEQIDGATQVSVGSLAGLAVGSILAVHPVEASADTTVLGYVRVTDVTPTSARVESCAHAGCAAVKLASLPESARCTLAVQELGEMRLRLYITPASDDVSAAACNHLRAAVAGLPAEIKAMVQQVDEESAAQWVLQPVGVAQARREFHVAVESPAVILRQPRGRQLAQPTVAVEGPDADEPARHAAFDKVYAKYPLIEARDLMDRIGLDLRRIVVWQNMWRIAERARDPNAESDLVLEVALLKGKNDRTGGESLRGSYLSVGQRFEIRLKNTGIDDLWVSLFYLDSRFGIESWVSQSIRAGQSFRPIRAEVTDDSIGPEGVVVLTTPLRVRKQQPDYGYLEQGPLMGEESRTRSAPPEPETPFDRLLQAAAYGTGTRSAVRDVADNPEILSWSWITRPAMDRSRSD